VAYLDTEGVAGSNPASPTKKTPGRGLCFGKPGPALYFVYRAECSNACSKGSDFGCLATAAAREMGLSQVVIFSGCSALGENRITGRAAKSAGHGGLWALQKGP